MFDHKKYFLLYIFFAEWLVSHCVIVSSFIINSYNIIRFRYILFLIFCQLGVKQNPLAKLIQVKHVLTNPIPFNNTKVPGKM